MNEDKALLSFSIGPVQDFIAAARTVRDLWSGSYILSWLTAHAGKAVTDGGGEMVFPQVDDNPLYKAVCGPEVSDASLLSCLPNTFIVEIPGGEGEEIARACEQAVRKEWLRIAEKVREHLKEGWNDYPGWDYDWSGQVENFWDIRVAVQPPVSKKECERLQREFHVEVKDEQGSEDWLFHVRMDILGRLAGAQKAIRHYPPHAPEDDTRPKCIQTGAHAQMGPLARGTEDAMSLAREFWKNASSKAHDRWERLQEKDRFGAVALVKRFAWSQYFSERLARRPEAKKVSDTSTTASGGWLSAVKQLTEDSKPLHEKIEENLMKNNDATHWSGNWLYPHTWGIAFDEDSPPPEVQEEIRMALN